MNRIPLSLGSHTLHLPSGHRLGYHISGHLPGFPVFYLHGSPSSRLEGDEWHPSARKVGVCMISLDRPGMGLSSLRPGYRLTDIPRDIEALASHLHIERFKVIGSSGGGPYALACAKVIPTDKLLGTGVVGGVAPPDAGYEGASRDRRFAFWFSWIIPESLLRWSFDSVLWWYKKDDGFWRRIVEEGIVKSMPDSDKEGMTEEETDSLVVTMRDCFGQGAAGYAREAKILFKNWGFRLEDIPGKVRLFNGDKDSHTPVSGARWMVERLPNATLRVFEGDSHVTIFRRRDEEILKEVLDL